MRLGQKSKKHFWTEQEDEKLRQLHALEKYNRREIALQMGLPESVVTNRACKLGIPYSYRQPEKTFIPQDKMPDKASAKMKHRSGAPVAYDDCPIACRPEIRINFTVWAASRG